MKVIPRSLLGRAALAAATCTFTAASSLQAQDVLVDIELSLVVDVSGSVDPSEYAL